MASDWGGQTVEAFSSPDALNDKTCGGTQPGARPVRAAALAPTGEPNPGPTQLWFAMIYPVLPMRLAGATWYQGEANAGDPTSYACRFPAMISDWRRKFNLTLPFYFVQLAGEASDPCFLGSHRCISVLVRLWSHPRGTDGSTEAAQCRLCRRH